MSEWLIFQASKRVRSITLWLRAKVVWIWQNKSDSNSILAGLMKYFRKAPVDLRMSYLMQSRSNNKGKLMRVLRTSWAATHRATLEIQARTRRAEGNHSTETTLKHIWTIANTLLLDHRFAKKLRGCPRRVVWSCTSTTISSIIRTRWLSSPNRVSIM